MPNELEPWTVEQEEKAKTSILGEIKARQRLTHSDAFQMDIRDFSIISGARGYIYRNCRFGCRVGGWYLQLHSEVPGLGEKITVMHSENTGGNPMSEEPTVEHHMTVWLILHSIPAAHGSPGIVVDADVAARTPCTAYGKIWFSKGIVGALSEAQKAAYCPTTEYKTSPGIERRLAQWNEAVGVCKKEIEDIPKGERLEPWLSCMGRELPARGIEI